MASNETKQLEQRMAAQSADYLSRLEQEGQLPTVISKAMADAGGAEQAALRNEEAKLLTNYVSAGAENREKYKDVWDPFARDSLASRQTAMNYAPIANIRNELAMRAEALGVAVNSSVAMHQAGTQQAQAGLGITEGAYNRAWQREQAEAQAAEAERDRQFRAAESAKSRASSGSSKSVDKTENKIQAFKQDLATGLGANVATSGEEGSRDLDGNDLGYITREQLIQRLIIQHPDIDENDIKRAVYSFYAG